MKRAKKMLSKLKKIIAIIIIINIIFVSQVSAKTFLQTAGGVLIEPVLNFVMYIGDTVENQLNKTLYTQYGNEDAVVDYPVSDVMEDIADIGVFALTVKEKLLKIDLESYSDEMLIAYLGLDPGVYYSSHYGTKIAEALGHETKIMLHPIINLADDAYEETKSYVLKVIDMLRKVRKSLVERQEELAEGRKVVTVEPFVLKTNAFDIIDIPNGEIYSPYEIFSNQIPLLDVNFISPHEYKKTIWNIDMQNFKIYSEEEDVESSAEILQKTISSWYEALRNIAIVALMSVLLYIGIRIVVSSSNSEKARYKELIFDWLTALCLIFFMHYIMSFMINMTENISLIISEGANTLIKVPIQVNTILGVENENFNIITNFSGYVRLTASLLETNGSTLTALEYIILYVVLVAYTVMFTVIYMKRVIYMAFLTVISPITAVTYPFRKQRVGGGQAFALWLREYVANLIIQPIHLLLYSITIGSVMEFAVEHPIYAIVALVFFIPAEKMIMEFFGLKNLQYADTGRTMNSESRILRKNAMIAGNVAGNLSSGLANGLKKIRVMTLGESSENKHIKQLNTEKNIENATENNKNEKNYFSKLSQEILNRNLTNSNNEKDAENIQKSIFESIERSVEKSVDSKQNDDIETKSNYKEYEKNIRNTIHKDEEKEFNDAMSTEKNNQSNIVKEQDLKIETNINFDQEKGEAYREYSKNGITNINEFEATYALEEKGMSREEAIATYQIAKQTGDVRNNENIQQEWLKKISINLSQNQYIKEMMQEQRNLITEKYLKNARELKEKHNKKNNSNQEYRRLKEQVEDLEREMKNNQNKELDDVEQIPIRFAKQILSNIEDYYNNLE